MDVGSEVVSDGDTVLEERNSLNLEGGHENHDSVVTTAVLEDIAAKKALVVKIGQQIALENAANLLLSFQG